MPTPIRYQNGKPVNLPSTNQYYNVLLYGVLPDDRPVGPTLGNWDSISQCWTNDFGALDWREVTHFALPPIHPERSPAAPAPADRLTAVSEGR